MTTNHQDPHPAATSWLETVCGSEDAFSILLGFHRLCEVWDDAVDREHNESEWAINKAFEWALFELPRNPFWLKHRSTLEPAMQVCIANWKAATRIEREGGPLEALQTAWVLRCSPYDFFVALALCAGGPDAAARAAHYWRSQVTSDTLEAYLAEHRKD